MGTQGGRTGVEDKQEELAKAGEPKDRLWPGQKGQRMVLGKVKGASKAASKQQAASPKKQKAQTKRPHLQKAKKQELKKP